MTKRTNLVWWSSDITHTNDSYDEINTTNHAHTQLNGIDIEHFEPCLASAWKHSVVSNGIKLISMTNGMQRQNEATMNLSSVRILYHQQQKNEAEIKYDFFFIAFVSIVGILLRLIHIPMNNKQLDASEQWSKLERRHNQTDLHPHSTWFWRPIYFKQNHKQQTRMPSLTYTQIYTLKLVDWETTLNRIKQFKWSGPMDSIKSILLLFCFFDSLRQSMEWATKTK